MDKKSRAVLIILVVAVLASIAFTFYKTIILQEFEIVNSEESGEM